MKLTFIVGHGKTGTSSILAALNAHPSTFLLYEAYLARPGGPQPRGEAFLEKWPDLRPLLSPGGSLQENYQAAGNFLAERGHEYAYFGDKILYDSLQGSHVEEVWNYHTIFVVRDIRTWLCKNVVVADYDTADGLLGKMRTYVNSLLDASASKSAMIMSLEDFILDQDKSLDRLSQFLDSDLKHHARKWWNKVGNYEPQSPKNAVSWWIGHDSSQLKPGKLDTQAVLKEHPIWLTVLPIFDKYYKAPDHTFPPQEIEEDKAALEALAAPNLKLEDLYAEANSVSFGSGLLGTFGHRSKNPHVKPFTLKSPKK